MLLLYGFETVPASWHVDEEIPTLYTRIYFVHSGYVKYWDNGAEVILKPQHMYCFPTDKSYHMRHGAENPLNCFFLHLNITPYTVDKLFELDYSKDPFVFALLLAMKQALGTPVAKKLTEPLSKALSTYLVEIGAIKNFPGPITLALKYIMENIEKNPTVEEISAHCGYNSRYFIRIFTKHLGSTPHQYILFYKMQLAVRLLGSGTSPTKISEQLGFAELKGFSRCFKRQFGISPTQFKKHFIFMP